MRATVLLDGGRRALRACGKIGRTGGDMERQESRIVEDGAHVAIALARLFIKACDTRHDLHCRWLRITYVNRA